MKILPITNNKVFQSFATAAVEPEEKVHIEDNHEFLDFQDLNLDEKIHAADNDTIEISKTEAPKETQKEALKEEKPNTHKHEKVPTKVKVAAIAGSVAGALAFLFFAAKGQNKGDFNSAKSLDKVKQMFKVDYEKNFLVPMGLAASATIGGTLGGLIIDKKDKRKPKIKECIHQILGNVIVPITLVGVAASQIKKIPDLSKTKKIVYNGLAAIAGVGAGVTGGNWLASKVTKTIYNEKDERKVGPQDFGIHVDDLLTVIALNAKGEALKEFIGKALPAIFLICGYQAGTGQPHTHGRRKHKEVS